MKTCVSCLFYKHSPEKPPKFWDIFTLTVQHSPEHICLRYQSPVTGKTLQINAASERCVGGSIWRPDAYSACGPDGLEWVARQGDISKAVIDWGSEG